MLKGGLYLAIGDSITWTIDTVGEDLYATRIWRYICNNYAPIKMINKGIGGIKSDGLVKNLMWSASLKPDLVTIGVGMNDCVGAGIPTATYKANLTKAIDMLRLRNPQVHIILCTPSRSSDVNRTPYIQSYRDAMSEVAVSKNVSIAHFENAFLQTEIGTYSFDGVHPNGTGHGKIYDILLPVVLTGSWLSKIGK